MATGQQKGASIVGEANEQRKWEREEVVILVTEYFRTKNLTQDEIIDSQNQISIFLKKRERILTGVEPPDVFRNYAGIHMQSGRIRCLDPDTKYFGMQGTKLQKKIVREHLTEPKKVLEEAEQIYTKYGR